MNIQNKEITLETFVEGDGRTILCVHGFPETAHCWRHQVDYFVKAGYKVVTMNQRGYGSSSSPDLVESYRIDLLASDVAAVAQHHTNENEKTILFGHDWGAPTAYATAMLYPDLIKAVAGLSVCFTPFRSESSLSLWKEIYKDRFFYQNYFQCPDLPEQELEANIRSSLQKIYFVSCGDFFRIADKETRKKIASRPASSKMLDHLPDPSPFPAWLPNKDLDKIVKSFEQSGFHGPIHRYRAQIDDPKGMKTCINKNFSHPHCFIGGEFDSVRHFVSGYDLYENADKYCDDCRSVTIIPDVGHWVQQEAPKATNKALHAFVDELS